MRMRHFWVQNGPFAPNKKFFRKLLISFSSTYYPPSLCKIFKEFFQQSKSYEDEQFLGLKWPIPPNENLFRKPANEPCFFHSCLSTCQKSKSDINLLVKYWRLKNTEISLAKSHFGCNLGTRFFPSLYFSQKTQKPCFLGHFWPSKSPKTMFYGPLTPC